MTNKLRSVIKENRKKTSALCLMLTDSRVDTMDIIRHVEHVQSILLDAIIEEMEEEESNRGKEFININKEKDPTGRLYNLGGIQALTDQISKLKQAREELSSLTQ